MFQHSKSEFLEITIDDNESKAITHNGIEITIDRKKCNYSMYDPTGCRKCIQLCTPGVLTTRPIEKRDFSIPPKDRIDPTKWILMATLGRLVQWLRYLHKGMSEGCDQYKNG